MNIACLRGLILSLVLLLGLWFWMDRSPSSEAIPRVAVTSPATGSLEASTGFDVQTEPAEESEVIVTPLVEVEAAESAELPAEQALALEEALQRARYAVRPIPVEAAEVPDNGGASHMAANPAQDMTARFLTDGGVKLASGRGERSWQGTLRLVTAGSDRASSPRGWQVRDGRVEYAHHANITEWYVNKPEGFEQGFTVHWPEATTGGWMELRLSLDGLRAEVDAADSSQLHFIDVTSEQAVAGYRELKVWDAEGQPLAAEMRAGTEGPVLAFNTAGARFPVTVDPLVYSLENYYTGFGADDRWGSSTSLTNNLAGMMAAIGVPGDDNPRGNNAGAIYVFRLGSAGWEEYGNNPLVDPAGAAEHRFGAAVALRGSTLVGGAPAAFNYRGKIVTFDFSFLEGLLRARNAFEGEAQGDQFGISVDLAGQVMAVGAFAADNNDVDGSGKAYAFWRTADFQNWQRESVLTPRWQTQLTFPPRWNDDTERVAYFGWKVAVCGTDILVSAPYADYVNNLLIGGPQRIADAGKVYVYRRSAGGWDIAQGLIAGSPELKENAHFGASLAGNGTMAVVGLRPGLFIGTLDNTSNVTGAGVVFTLNNNSWTRQQALVPPGDNRGTGVAVAVHGNTAVVSSIRTLTDPGRIDLWQRDGSTWTHTGVITPPDVPVLGGLVNTQQFGYGLALYDKWVLAGAPGDGSLGLFNPITGTRPYRANHGGAYFIQLGANPTAELNIIRSGAGVILRWRQAGGYQLQTSTDLRSWSRVADIADNSPGERSDTVSGTRFFRLKRN